MENAASPIVSRPARVTHHRAYRRRHGGRSWRDEGMLLIMLAPAASFGFTFMLTKGLIQLFSTGDWTYLILWAAEAYIGLKLLWPGFLEDAF
ncbi:hypothetical protein WG922_20410 [Ramlibacter sp. AN1015]|uniref:hypothetical protein n=1 Tax=Ramlibacter sp. AN1015 TaxID=3133428 RepID=UPI0030BF04AB